MKSQEIRNQFLEFFKSKKHDIVSSAPMVIKDDPTLMFTNAGMNQFKEYFLGNGVPKNNRITDTQKCLRVSGKHNDLEEVGMDTYHHTMFEMLGNWSFGNYFKKEAIQWAWELLTEVYGVDKDILYVSVFEGSKDDELGMDQEAYDLWSAIVPEDRIIMGNKKDNFWEMGDQGPCGPCSEIHVDIRSDEEKAKTPGRDLVNADHPHVVEIWNLVFMQYNRKANGSLEKLPAQHVDTGMGFERLCMVLQGEKSNYDTDVFTPLIREIETITKSKYDKNSLPSDEDGKVSVAIRVIADHVRAVSFSIADGQLPSNTGAGYVIRRILRRAIRYGFTFLDTKEPFIYRLVSVLVKKMGDAFPELKDQKQLIQNVIKEEEYSFLRTLDQGLVLLDSIIAETTGKVVSGKKVFKLYDTYGFPKDLTGLILFEKGLTYEEEAFDVEMQKQKEGGRAATSIATGDWVVLDDDKETEFVGYDSLESRVKIVRYRKVETKKEGVQYQIVFNLTPFYAEGGGQVGDKGYLEASNGEVVYVVDTKKENNLLLHITKELPKDVTGTFKAAVDERQRFRTACNHTATHLLHQALRTILGTHVEQKGSAVHSKYLRFDFSHYNKLTVEELRDVESFVNSRIEGKLPFVEQRGVSIEVAQEQGAMALFGEKYGDTVRTVRFGESIELCGGTHVQNTGDIWHFKIKSEGAIASGIRRIEAITGDATKEFYFENNRTFYEIKDVLKNPKDPVKTIKGLQEENVVLKKQIEALLKDKAKNLKGGLKKEFEEVNGINFLAKKIDLDAAGIKDLSFEIGGELENVVMLFGSDQNGKALLSCYISKNLVEEKQLNAGQVVRELGKYIQGGGGGQPFFATAGGKNPAGVQEALDNARQYLK
ncbi:alanine--tRNA ligase [Aquimarina aquimarini]|uniref:alanine--tRNA ligase n=1 Tax=Aquimarina aquimarini TaxID=1191734 RepID=UPI000D54CA83|nr:alanine--tRNA ligase [Aquimarina aquimarini]